MTGLMATAPALPGRVSALHKYAMAAMQCAPAFSPPRRVRGDPAMATTGLPARCTALRRPRCRAEAAKERQACSGWRNRAEADVVGALRASISASECVLRPMMAPGPGSPAPPRPAGLPGRGARRRLREAGTSGRSLMSKMLYRRTLCAPRGQLQKLAGAACLSRSCTRRRLLARRPAPARAAAGQPSRRQWRRPTGSIAVEDIPRMCFSPRPAIEGAPQWPTRRTRFPRVTSTPRGRAYIKKACSTRGVPPPPQGAGRPGREAGAVETEFSSVGELGPTR